MEPPVPVYFHLLKDSQDSFPTAEAFKTPPSSPCHHPAVLFLLFTCHLPSKIVSPSPVLPIHTTRADYKPQQVAAGWPTCHRALPQHQAAPSSVPGLMGSSQQCPCANGVHSTGPSTFTAKRGAQHPAVTSGFPAHNTGLHSSILDLYHTKTYTDTGRTLLKTLQV